MVGRLAVVRRGVKALTLHVMISTPTLCRSDRCDQNRFRTTLIDYWFDIFELVAVYFQIIRYSVASCIRCHLFALSIFFSEILVFVRTKSDFGMLLPKKYQFFKIR